MAYTDLPSDNSGGRRQAVLSKYSSPAPTVTADLPDDLHPSVTTANALFAGGNPTPGFVSSLMDGINGGGTEEPEPPKAPPGWKWAGAPGGAVVPDTAIPSPPPGWAWASTPGGAVVPAGKPAATPAPAQQGIPEGIFGVSGALSALGGIGERVVEGVGGIGAAIDRTGKALSKPSGTTDFRETLGAIGGGIKDAAGGALQGTLGAFYGGALGAVVHEQVRNIPELKKVYDQALKDSGQDVNDPIVQQAIAQTIFDRTRELASEEGKKGNFQAGILAGLMDAQKVAEFVGNPGRAIQAVLSKAPGVISRVSGAETRALAKKAAEDAAKQSAADLVAKNQGRADELMAQADQLRSTPTPERLNMANVVEREARTLHPERFVEIDKATAEAAAAAQKVMDQANVLRAQAKQLREVETPQRINMAANLERQADDLARQADEIRSGPTLPPRVAPADAPVTPTAPTSSAVGAAVSPSAAAPAPLSGLAAVVDAPPPISGGVPGVTGTGSRGALGVVDNVLPPTWEKAIDNLDIPDTAKASLKGMVDGDPELIDAQRRGTLTMDLIKNRAEQMDLDISKIQGIKPGTTANAEQTAAVLNGLAAKAKEFQSISDEVAAAGAAATDIQKAQLLSVALEQSALLRVVYGLRAEAGRSLRTYGEFFGGNKANFTTDTFGRLVNAVGGKQNADEIISLFIRAKNDKSLSSRERQSAIWSVIEAVGQKPGKAQYLEDVFMNGILSNPVTHIRNVLTQSALLYADSISAIGSAGIESVASRLAGRQSERTFKGALAGFQAMHVALPQAWRAVMAETLRPVSQSLLKEFEATGKVRLPAFSGKMGVVNAPTRALNIEDAFFSTLARQRSLAMDAVNMSGGDSLKAAELLKHPTKEMMDRAIATAERAQVRQAPGDVTKMIARARDLEIPGTGFRPLFFVVPFVRAPINLLKIGAEYSPAGFVAAKRAGSAGETADALAKATIGSAAMTALVMKAQEGEIITGAAPLSASERDEWAQQGKTPYSMKIGGNWVGFGNLQPVAQPLRWAAGLSDAMRENKDEGKIDFTLDGAASLGGKIGSNMAKEMIDQTYLQGLNDLSKVATDPESRLTPFLGRTAAGMVPFSGLLRGVTQAFDPEGVVRSAPPNDIVAQIEVGIPGLSGNVPPLIGLDGEDVKRSGFKTGALGFVNPVTITPEKQDAVTMALESLTVNGPLDEGGEPTPARKFLIGRVSEDVAGMKLNTAEARRYRQMANSGTYGGINLLVTSPQWTQMTPQDQVDAVRKVISNTRKVAQAQLGDEMVAGSDDPGQIKRGAVVRLNTVSALDDRAKYIQGLRLQGKLTPEVVSFLNKPKNEGGARRETDPQVAQYLAAIPYMENYAKIRPYLGVTDAQLARDLPILKEKQEQIAEIALTDPVRADRMTQTDPLINQYRIRVNPQLSAYVKQVERNGFPLGRFVGGAKASAQDRVAVAP